MITNASGRRPAGARTRTTSLPWGVTLEADTDVVADDRSTLVPRAQRLRRLGPIWFADEPLGRDEGAKAYPDTGVVIVIDIPPELVTEYYIDDLVPEWCIPAELANRYLVGTEEAG